jgi:hypothetical protein
LTTEAHRPSAGYSFQPYHHTSTHCSVGLQQADVTTMDPNAPPASDAAQPSLFRWILGFLLVGACWGLTTPFMRRAALSYTPPTHAALSDPRNSWLKKKVLGIWYAVIGVLSRPAYAVPLLLNVTGSVWFFVLIGKAGKSLCGEMTCKRQY